MDIANQKFIVCRCQNSPRTRQDTALDMSYMHPKSGISCSSRVRITLLVRGRALPTTPQPHPNKCTHVRSTLSTRGFRQKWLESVEMAPRKTFCTVGCSTSSSTKGSTSPGCAEDAPPRCSQCLRTRGIDSLSYEDHADMRIMCGGCAVDTHCHA